MNELINLKRLEIARKEAGYTQLELASRLGISGTMYHRYKIGEKELDEDMINSIALILSVSKDWLIGKSNIPYDRSYEKPYIPPKRDKIKIDTSWVR